MNVQTPLKFPYRPRPLQKQFHANAKRFNCIVTHRRFGKTTMALAHMLRAVANSNLSQPRAAYIHPIRARAKDIAWDTILKPLCRGLPVEFNESELRVDFKHNGARLTLYGMDRDPDSLRGLYLDWAWLDEYQGMRPEFLPRIIMPTLADRKGCVGITGTPQGENALFEAVRTAQANPDRWYLGVHKASETFILDADELVEQRRQMSEEEYLQEYECDFAASVRGSYYGKWMQQAGEEGRIGIVKPDPTLPVNTIWDVGYRDYTAIIFAQYNRDQINIVHAYQNMGQGLPFYLSYLQQWQAKTGCILGKHYAPHDFGNHAFQTGKTGFDIARQLGFKFYLTPDIDVQPGIDAARLVLPRCRFDAIECANLIKALQLYRKDFNHNLQVFKDKPLHDEYSHLADAFRYLAVSYKAVYSVEDSGDIFLRMPTMNEVVAEHLSSRSSNNDQLPRI